MPKYLYNSEEYFKATDGVYLLNVIPLFLPPYLNNREEMTIIYRQFVRLITQEFDKVNYKNPSINKRKLSYIRVLHNIRNWTSHDSKALTNLDESDVAYIFLLFLYISFDSKSILHENLKSILFETVGANSVIELDELKEKIIDSYENVIQRGRVLPDEVRGEFDQTDHFSQKVNILIQNGCLMSGEHGKFIYRIFWHNIVFIDDSSKLSPQSIYFDNNEFLNELTRRIYLKSF